MLDVFGLSHISKSMSHVGATMQQSDTPDIEYRYLSPLTLHWHCLVLGSQRVLATVPLRSHEHRSPADITRTIIDLLPSHKSSIPVTWQPNILPLVCIWMTGSLAHALLLFIKVCEYHLLCDWFLCSSTNIVYKGFWISFFSCDWFLCSCTNIVYKG